MEVEGLRNVSRVSLKHDGTDGPDGKMKMANLPVPSVSDRRDTGQSVPSVCDRRDTLSRLPSVCDDW